MKIEMSSYSPFFGATPVSDLFFTRYLPSMDAECVKIYLYLLYLASHNENVTPDELAQGIGYSKDTVGTKLIDLQQIGLLNYYTDRIIVTNLPQAELEKSYRPRTTADAQADITETKRLDDKYRKPIKTINDRFFEGRMPANWYTDIMLWVEKYSFEPETLFLLFQHCRDALKKMPTKSYVMTVADSWGSKGIRTAEQVEAYLARYDEFKKYRNAVQKKLKMADMTVFQEKIVDKWFFDYKFSIEIVDIALAKSANKLNVSLNFFDTILTDWFNRNLRTPAEIEAYEIERKKQFGNSQPVANVKPLPPKNGIPAKQTKSANFSERKYDEDFLNNFVGGFDND